MSTVRRGLIAVISGPSGSGKGTLINRIMKQDKDVCYAVYILSSDYGVVLVMTTKDMPKEILKEINNKGEEK